MKQELTEKIMQNALWRLTAAALMTCLACTAGCHFPDFRGILDGAQNKSSGGDIERLSDRQVADVQLSLARSLEQQGDHSRALEAYRNMAEKDPRRATAYWRMAVLHDRQGNIKDSEALYRQALKLEPKNADIHVDFGYSLYLQKRWGEAEDHLRRAIAIKSGNQRAHNNLGLLLAQTERTDEALDEFHKSGCREAEARANLAFVMTLNHRWDEAREQYEAALDVNPDSPGAKTGLDNLNALVAKTSPDGESVTLATYESPAKRHSAGTPLAQRSQSAHAVVPVSGRAD